MSNVYVKRDGVTSKLFENTINNKAFQSYRVDAMDMLKGIEQVKSSDLLLTGVRKLLDGIKKENEANYNTLINILGHRIINLKNISELADDEDSIFNMIVSDYLYVRKHSTISTKLFSYYTKETDMVASHLQGNILPSLAGLVKDIVRRYVRLHVYSYSTEELNNIYQSVIDGEDPLKFIVVEDGLTFDKIEDETLKTLVRNLFVPEMNIRIDEGAKHLCFDCKVPIKECPKICDRTKKNISEYDFITDGKQVTHEVKGVKRLFRPGEVVVEQEVTMEEVDSFTVTKCKKYIK